MKKIFDPVVNTLTDTNESQYKQSDCSSSSRQELGPIQKDRSFLPNAKDNPVHKCGC